MEKLLTKYPRLNWSDLYEPITFDHPLLRIFTPVWKTRPNNTLNLECGVAQNIVYQHTTVLDELPYGSFDTFADMVESARKLLDKSVLTGLTISFYAEDYTAFLSIEAVYIETPEDVQKRLAYVKQVKADFQLWKEQSEFRKTHRKELKVLKEQEKEIAELQKLVEKYPDIANQLKS